MSTKISELTLRRLKPPKAGRRLLGPDGVVPGMRWRHNQDGTFTADLRPRIDGRQVPIIVGHHPQVGLAEIRKRAWQIKEELRQGIDPRHRELEPKRYTVTEVVEKFIERKIKPAKRWREVEAMLQRDLVAAWGDRPIASITERHALDLIEEIERRAPVVANRNVRLLKRLGAWAVKAKYLQANSFADLERVHKEQPRQRWLTEDEIGKVWPAFEQMGYPFGTIGQLLLLLGARRGEVASMKWAQLDLQRGLWRLPPMATKTNAEHLVPLPPLAVEILRQIPRIDGSPLVFPAGRIGSDRPVSGFSKTLRTAHRLSNTGDWTWHDLRRTVRTHLARLGVPQHIGERVLGHATGGESQIAQVYNRYRYEAEVRRALELWANELERIVTGGETKIVTLAGARP
jgi:integrase